MGRLSLASNTNRSLLKVAVAPNRADLKQLLQLAKNKLQLKGIQGFYLESGRQLKNGDELPEDALLLAHRGEGFVGKVSVVAEEEEVLQPLLPPAPTPFERKWQCKEEDSERSCCRLRVQTFNLLAPCLAQGSIGASKADQTVTEESASIPSMQHRSYGVHCKAKTSQCRDAQSHNFQCSQEYLTWGHRFPRLQTELLQHQPDLLCLQELDVTAWEDVQRLLRDNGYSGGVRSATNGGVNNFVGMFWKEGRLSAVREHEEIYLKAQGTIAALAQRLCVISDANPSDRSTTFLAVTTHFKAGLKKENEQDRAKQTTDLLAVLDTLVAPDEDIIFAGDLNSHVEPLQFFPAPGLKNGQAQEPLPSLVLPCLERKGFRCAVQEATGRVMAFSQWCLRGDVEIKSTIDHILLRGSSISACAALAPPTDAAVIAEGCLPNIAYPSDHIPVVVDVALKSFKHCSADQASPSAGHCTSTPSEALQLISPSIYEKDLLTLGRDLPQNGRVALTEDGFKYVALPKEWQVFRDRLAEAAASFYRSCESDMLVSDRSTLEKQLALKRDGAGAYDWGFWTPQSCVGLHISLGKHGDAMNVGKRVRFQVRRLLDFQSRKLGEPSSSDESIFCARWFTFEVKLVDVVRCEGEEPHISFAMFGAKLL